MTTPEPHFSLRDFGIEPVTNIERDVADGWLTEFLQELDDISAGLYRVDFIGQAGVKDQLEPFFSLDQFPHTLITGEPGLGKTQLSRWIAYRLRASFEEKLCPVTPESLPEDGVVLLDEVHRQRNPEPLFPIMERNVTVTILGATTTPEKLEPAFASRFFNRIQLRRYDTNDMIEVVKHLAEGEVDNEHATKLAKASAGNPRQAERLVMIGKGLGTYDPATILPRARVTVEGFDEIQLDYLDTLHKLSRPVGLEQLATLLYLDAQTVRERERLLIERRLVNLHTNGRSLTTIGRKYVERMRSATWTAK